LTVSLVLHLDEPIVASTKAAGNGLATGHGSVEEALIDRECVGNRLHYDAVGCDGCPEARCSHLSVIKCVSEFMTVSVSKLQWNGTFRYSMTRCIVGDGALVTVDGGRG
jgi:hypothetical protein